MIDEKDKLMSLIRSCICAPEGKEFLCADFNAIEARVVLWMVGDEPALEIFRTGQDIYCDMAESIYGHAVNKKDHPEKRALGKTCILGLSYGMGHKKFGDTCEQQGVDLSGLNPEDIVKTYRTKYKKIRNWWYSCEDWAVAAIREPDTVHGRGLIRFKCSTKRDALLCQLPSGRLLSWCKPWLDEEYETPWGAKKPQIHYSGLDITKHWSDQTTYGGSMVESIVQGTARDLLCEAMLRLDRAGYNIVMHVHDEVMAEVDEGAESLDVFCDIMKEVPEWAEGCPIEVEGFSGRRFRK